jgi:hypothetical protein
MISGHDLIKKYGIQDLDLFNLIKSGLTAYSETGRQIVDIDTLPRKKKTLEEIEGEIRARSSGAKEEHMPPATSGNEKTIETSIKELAHMEFKRQIGDPICPPHCDMMDFTLPSDNEKAKKKLKEIKYFRFKLKDVSKFLQHVKVQEK